MVERRLSCKSYLLRSEQANCEARVQADRLRKASQSSIGTEDPQHGVFPDGLRLIKVGGVKDRKHSDGTGIRMFQVQLRGLKSPRWTPKQDLPEAVVAAWTRHMKESADSRDSNDYPARQ